MRELPPRQRSVLLLRYAGDMTHAQVAAALGCSEEASRQAAREGLDRLRKEISTMTAKSPLSPPASTRAAAQAAARRFADEAPADVRYAVLDTPVGRLVAAVTDRGLTRLAYDDSDGGVDAILESIARRLSPRILERQAALDPLARELDEYFAGTRRRFEVPIDWSLVHGFGRRVLDAAVAIPYGEVSTYGEVAARAGVPSAPAQPATRSATTRCRSSSPATASCAAAARSAATPAASSASRSCSRSSAAS